MKYSIYFFLIGFNLLLLVILMFFRDRFLFFLAGFDSSLLNKTTVEAFKAFAAIQKWRQGLVCVTILIGGINIYYSPMLEKMHGSKWYLKAGLGLGIVTLILAIIMLLMYIILPKRVF